LRVEVEDASERENNALQALRDNESETQDEIRKLRSRVDELTSEQGNWQGKQKEYEEKIQKNIRNLVELQTQYGDLENKRKSADGSRTEIETLKKQNYLLMKKLFKKRINRLINKSNNNAMK